MKAKKEELIKPGEFEIIKRHLKESHRISKHPIFLRDYGSAIIEHRMIIRTVVNEHITMESEITFMPLVRRYQKGKEKIIDDDNLVYEVMEEKEEC